MRKEQSKDILAGWHIYHPDKQKTIVNDYLRLCNGYYSPEGFLTYLKDRLELDGWWRKGNLA